MEKLGPTGQEAFLKVASAVASAELPIRRSNKLLTELWVTMKNTARWQLTSNALHGFQGALASAYGYSKDLNRSLTDIRIVSGQSAEQMAEFADQANKAAKSLSATTLDYTDAALIYYQQGLPEEEIAERTETTIKMANVTRDSAQEVSDQMTAIWNNFDDGSKSLEYYADVITALGAATASSTSEIATGLEKFAAIAETTGLSYEYATSALATVTSVTRQSADTVGTAFKTLFARIQGLTLGETLDDGTTLNKYSEALNKVGINIKDASGEMKDMDNILDEMGAKWETLGKNEQTALAQTVAGVRQYTQLMALMDNWDFFKENLTTARGAEGELDKQADIYAESWEAARDRVRVSAEDIYDSIINPDFFISLDNAISPVLTGIADMIDAAGGLGGVLKVAAFAMTKLYGDEVAVGLRTTIENFKILTGLAGKAAKETQKGIVEQAQDLTISYTPNQSQKTQLVIMQEEVLLQQKINEKSSLLSTYQLEHIKNEKAKADLYKAQAIEASKLATQLETDVSNIKEDIIIDVSLKKGWKDDLKKSLGKKDDADLAKTIFGSEFQKSGKNATELVEKLNKMGGNSRKMVDQVTSEMQKLIKTTAGMNTLKRALGDLDSITDENAKSFKEAAVALKLMTQEEVNSIKNSSELTAKLKGIDSTVSNSGVKIKDLKTVLSTLGADSTQLRAFVSNLREFATELSESETYLSLFEEEIENLSDGINQNTIPDLNDWASELVNVANSLSAVGMGIQGIQSLGSIWMDEDATIGEKIIHTMTSLAMILPAITALQELYTKAKGEDGIVSTFAAGAQGVMAAASQKLGLSAASATPGVLGLSAAIKTLLGPIGWFLAVGGIVISLFSGLKDALGGEDDLDNFAEAEKNLNNVNAELQETQNRINELKSKGNLSVVEAQELADLERKNDLLKEELKLREQILKTEKIEKTKTFMEESTDKADEIKKGQPNLKKPYSVKVKGTESKVNLSGDIEEAAAIAGYETLEEAIRSDDSFAKWADENSKAIAEFKSEFLNTLQEMEAGYVDMLSLMESGDLFVSEEQLNTQLKALENARLNYLQGDKKEYFKVYIQPVLETEAWQAELKESAEGAKDDAIHGILEDGFYDINNFSEKTKQAFIDAGINLEDYVGKMESNVARVKEIMGDEYGFFEGLDAKTINTVLSMDLTGIDNMDEFLPILIEGQQVIDVEILTNINESAKEAFDILSSGESLDSEQIQKLQSAFAGFYDFANMEGAALYSQIDMIKDAIDQTYDIVLSAGEESLNVINEQSKAYEELLEKEKKEN